MIEGTSHSLGRYRAWAEIDLSAIASNVKKLRELIGPKTQLMAVVKADGYGHGAEKVARVALSNGASWLGVATVDEGMSLRDAGIGAPILILAPIPVQRVYDAVCYDLRLTVCTEEMLKAASDAAEAAGKRYAYVHVKVDTGMGRIGILPESAVSFVKKAMTYSNVKVEGVFTHFATADEKNRSFTVRQFESFQSVKSALESEGVDVLYHAANSAAVLQYPEYYLDLVRTGIAVYGLYPSRDVRRDIELKPALEFKTRVIHVRRALANVSISYGATYVTDEPCTIATLGVGYADGFSRSLSNKGIVLIGGMRLPIVGRICMDQCMVKAPSDVDIKIGDEAVLIGKQGDEMISADEVAKYMGTINYEVVCMITGRVPRIYKDGSA